MQKSCVLDNIITLNNNQKTPRLIEIYKLTKITPVVNGGAELWLTLDLLYCFLFFNSAVALIPWSISSASIRLSFFLSGIMAHKYYDIQNKKNLKWCIIYWTEPKKSNKGNERISCKIKLVQVSKQRHKNNS